MTYTNGMCDECGALRGVPHTRWCTSKVDADSKPQAAPSTQTLPGRMTFQVLEKD